MSRRFVCRTMAMALESRAIGLGLDVVIEVAPETMD